MSTAQVGIDKAMAVKTYPVFFIEHSEDHWLLIQKALQDCLPQVSPSWAASPEQALAQLSEWETQNWDLPKLIVLDLYLPQREDAWRLIQQIKCLSAWVRQIPILVFSIESSQQVINQAYGMGVSSFIVKPSAFSDWPACFEELGKYWFETVTLPPLQF